MDKQFAMFDAFVDSPYLYDCDSMITAFLIRE